MKLLCCWLFMACALSSAARAQPAPGAAGALTGAWGGDRAQLVLDEQGGRLQMDCASGSFASPLRPAEDGSFRVLGIFERHAIGAQRADAGTLARPAQFVGEVKDGNLTLSIQAEGQDSPQVLHLRRGATVKLVRCL